MRVWFYDNTKRGDIVEVVNTVGSTLSGNRWAGRLEHPVGAMESGQRQHLTLPASPGVADGTRTRDSQDHNLVLYQLNYSHHCR